MTKSINWTETAKDAGVAVAKIAAAGVLLGPAGFAVFTGLEAGRAAYNLWQLMDEGQKFNGLITPTILTDKSEAA